MTRLKTRLRRRQVGRRVRARLERGRTHKPVGGRLEALVAVFGRKAANSRADALSGLVQLRGPRGSRAARPSRLRAAVRPCHREPVDRDRDERRRNLAGGPSLRVPPGCAPPRRSGSAGATSTLAPDTERDRPARREGRATLDDEDAGLGGDRDGAPGARPRATSASLPGRRPVTSRSSGPTRSSSTTATVRGGCSGDSAACRG